MNLIAFALLRSVLLYSTTTAVPLALTINMPPNVS
jgi:hypothetical protein